MESVDTSYSLQYLGYSLIHSYFTESMLQWIIGEIELSRRAHNVSMILSMHGLELKKSFVSRIPSTSDKNVNSPDATTDGMNLAENLIKFDDLGNSHNDNIDVVGMNYPIPHVVESILHIKYNVILHAKKIQHKQSSYFVFLTREHKDLPIQCHAFRGELNLLTIISQDIEKRIKLEGKNGVTCVFDNASHSSSGHEINDNDCVRFEVMLIGIVNLKNPDPPHTLIDEAVTQFDERYKKLKQQRNEHTNDGYKTSVTQHVSTPPDYIDSGSPPSSYIDDSREGSIHMLQQMRKRCGSMDHHTQKPTGIRRRQRHCSEPSTYGNDLKKTRIRLFQIGHKSVKMICPNKTVQNCEIGFSNISRCMQGIKHRDHFGIIANSIENKKQGQDDQHNAKHTNNMKKIICYVFKCAEDYICEEIMQGIRQAFTTCFNETSPMQEFDELCKDINAASPQDALTLAKQKMRDLNENEIQSIKAQILEINPKNSEDKLAAFMAALRQLYEVKHVEYLTETKATKGSPVQTHSDESASSKFDNIKSKAMSSFGSLLQKGKKKMQELQLDSDLMSDKLATSPVNKFKMFSESLSSSVPTTPQKNFAPQGLPSGSDEGSRIRKRSTSLGSRPASMEFSAKSSTSPLLFYHNIFYSITNTGPCAKPGHTPAVGCHLDKLKTIKEKPYKRHKTVEDIHRAWKWAISQQILLNKINAIIAKPANNMLSDYKYNSSSEFSDFDPIPDEMEDIWTELFRLSVEQKEKIEKRVLYAAVRKGVLSTYRARVWKLLRLHCHVDDEDNMRSKSNIGEYPKLLDNLTSYQHAILIDIGRTFPSHPMYSQLLGPGQLSLFNVLKAYSLYDEEVGYCQGLSFIAGVLLMHTCVEDEAYQLLYCLMHEIGCRNMYLPDMTGMKLAMYKITRLLYDIDLEIFQFFERHEITMMLVATPWFLTMFASTFPMNFVARVFDMVFVDGTPALFKVAICLLREHKSKFMQLDDFEDTVNYIRTEIPKSDRKTLSNVIENAMGMNFDSELKEYEVEYRILHEELPIYTYHTETEKNLREQIQCIENVNHKVTESNCDLLRQLHDAQRKIALLQKQLKEANKSGRNGN
uniref:TBC1 domain family member 1-like n=1 Tax=Styela clava TaxID=7725 RepID=UPI001939294D|nr:TBC1 domain family member 1-like [Styela clava]